MKNTKKAPSKKKAVVVDPTPSPPSLPSGMNIQIPPAATEAQLLKLRAINTLAEAMHELAVRLVDTGVVGAIAITGCSVYGVQTGFAVGEFPSNRGS